MKIFAVNVLDGAAAGLLGKRNEESEKRVIKLLQKLNSNSQTNKLSELVFIKIFRF